MAQKISMEAGLAACRAKLGDLVYENVLLHATIAALESENEELRTGQPSAAPIQEQEQEPTATGGYGSAQAAH